MTNREVPLSSEPGNSTTQFELGCDAYRAGDYSTAITSFEQVIQDDPSHFQAHYELGRSLVKLRRHARAVDSFRTALALKPTSHAALHEIGVSLRHLGQLRAAAEHLERALKQRPNQAATALALADVALELGEPERALDTVRALAASDLRPTEALALRERLERLKRNTSSPETNGHEAAATTVGAASASRPPGRLMRAVLGLGRLAGLNGSKAIGITNGSPAFSKTDPAALNDTELDASVRSIVDATKLDAASLWFCIELGALLRQRGLLDKARVVLEKATELRPASYEAALELGRTLNQLGAHEAAAAALRQAVRIKPQKPSGQRELGRALRHLGCTEEAIAAFRRALSLNPKRASTHLEVVRLYAAQGDLPAAEQALSDLATKTTDLGFSVRGALELAEAYRERRQPERALATIQRSLGVAPRDTRLLLRAGKICGELGRHAAALEYLTTATVMAPEHAWTWIELARAQMEAGLEEGAAASLERARSLAPRELSAQVALARLLRQRGALKDVQALAAGAPDSWQLQLELAQALRDAGRHDEAAMAFTAARRCAPSDPRARLELARLFRTCGRLRDARRLLVAMQEAGSKVQLELGRTLLGLGSLDDAAEAFRRAAAATSPTSVRGRALLALGRLQLHRGEVAQAAANLQQARRFGVPLQTVGLPLSRALIGSGQSDAALQLLEETIRESPETFEAYEELAALRLGSGDQVSSRKLIRKALEVARAVAERSPQDAAIGVRSAKLLARQGAPGDARGVLEGVVARHPTHAEGHLELARLLRNLGNYTGAEAAVARARDLNPDDASVHETERVVAGDLAVYRGGFKPELSAAAPGPYRRSEPRRILHLLETSLPHRRSGYAVRSRYILAGQAALGLELLAVTRPGVGEAGIEAVHGIDHARLPLEGDPNYNRHPLNRYLQQYAEKAFDEALAFRPDLIHAASNFKNGLVGLALARALGVPFVYELRGLWEDTQVSKGVIDEQSERYRFYNELETECLRHADAVVTLGEPLRREIIERGVAPERVFVVPNAVDSQLFPTVLRRRSLQRQLGLGRGPVLGYIGALVAYEGLDVLLEAFARVRANGLKARLIIVGDGDDRERLEGLAADLNLGSSVLFLGAIPHEELLDYYSLIDLFVLPRRRVRVCELVTPLKPFEAMSTGRTMVVSNVGGLRDAIIDGKTGVTFEADSAVDLARVCEELLASPVRRVQLGLQAAHWVRSRRQWSDVVGTYRNAYAIAAANALRRTSAQRLPSPGPKHGPTLRLGAERELILTSEPRSLTIAVDPELDYRLSGRVFAFPGEKPRAALVRFEVEGQRPSPALAEELGVRFSPKTGPYSYIPTDQGISSWSFPFRTPAGATRLSLHFQTWYPRRPVLIGSDVQLRPLAGPMDASTEAAKWIARLAQGDDPARVLADFDAFEAAADQKALAAELVAQRASGVVIAQLVARAFQLAPTRRRALALARDGVHYGALELLAPAVDLLAAARADLNEAERRALRTAEGYLALRRSLPGIPQRRASRRKAGGPVAMVLHCSVPHVTNGYATRSHSLLTALIAAGQPVVALTRPGFPGDAGMDGACPEREVVDQVEYRRLSGAHLRDDSLDRYIQRSAAELERSFGELSPSVVHAASAFTTGLPALIAARRLGIPFVYEVRGLWEITRASAIQGWGESARFQLERDLETLVAREADHVFAITRGLKEELVRRGVSADKISLAPNCVDIEKFSPSHPDPDLLQTLRFEAAPTIGYVGSLVDYEGLDDLLRALKMLRDRQLPFNCLIVGDGKERPKLEALASELGLRDKVVFTGRVPFETAEAYYSLVDVAPFPRKPLPVTEMVSPLKPFEAMAKGVAVVASDVGALEEIVKPEENGLLFRKGDANDLCEKLGTLLSDAERLARLKRQGRDWVVREKRWNAVAEHVAQVHQRLATSETIVPARLKLLVYGDVDLNLVDGSAIWAASLVELLAGLPETEVWLLLKAPLKRDTVVETIKQLPNVILVSPETLTGSTARLTQDKAAELVKHLHRREGFDLVVLRGFEVCRAVAEEPELYGVLAPYLVEVFQRPDPWDEATLADAAVIARASHTLLCQTDGIRGRLEQQVPEARGRTTLLPPMVPTSTRSERTAWAPDTPLKIVYSGKFAPLWGSRELFDIFAKLRATGFPCELHVYGDKIHNPPEDPSFRADIERALQSPGVTWHRALPRKEVLRQLPGYDLAWAWRRPELETTTDEVSTKLLEYGNAGLPVLLLGSPVNRRLLGDDYPLFVDNSADLVEALTRLSQHPQRLHHASEQAARATAPFTLDGVRTRYVAPAVETRRSPTPQGTLLVAGHDLKFTDAMLLAFRNRGYRVLIDKWQSHTRHDEAESKRLLAQADVVMCEWCLGNAEWYSHHVQPHQRLIVRFHFQELDLPYAQRMDLSRVSHLVFIAPHVQRKALAKFGWQPHPHRFRFIWNYVETERFARPKLDTARFTLGIVGIVPQRKRLDRALDLLEELAKVEPRFTLRIKGKRASDYPWMAKRADELRYYEEQEARIQQSPLLKDRVFFDGHGRDMEDWFRSIGFLLSPSDVEGSHVSVAEGMASGAVPVIVGWDGADELYPPEWCFEDVLAARASVISLSRAPAPDLDRIRRSFQNFIAARCDISQVTQHWHALITP